MRISLLATLLLATTFAAAQQTYCPESVSVTQSVEKTPDGWTATQDKLPTALATVTFFSGPPEQEASLVYDRWSNRNGLAFAVWHFPAKATPPIWISCRYSYTQVILSKQLPAGVSQCTVTYDPSVSVSGNPQIKKIACQ